jgi:hypothetical protein
MRRRRPAALAAVALLAGGCGGDEGRDSAGALAWSERPVLLVPAQAPDVVLQGRVRNDSLRPMKVRAKDVRVVDAEGERVQASVVFVNGLGKPLYRQDRPLELQPYDLRRLGELVELEPGEQAPLTVAWRRPDAPVGIDYGTGVLAIGEPRRLTEGAATEQAR